MLWAVVVVTPDPLCCEGLGFTENNEAILRQTRVSQIATEPLDVDVLLGLPKLDVCTDEMDGPSPACFGRHG